MALASPSRVSDSSVVPVEDLTRRVLEYQPAAGVELIRQAYEFADRAHAGQSRKSGAPYFAHPTAVAELIADLRLDAASVCAGLLHDVVEDTDTGVQDIERIFGAEIALLVDGVTKLSKIDFSSRQERDAESFRKMVVAVARDIRVLLIKLCDRVHNMHTLDAMSKDAQERIAKETLEIYAPLANRLGIQRFKSELEDLSFRYLEPDAWTRLVRNLAKTEKQHEKYIAHMSDLLRRQLAEHGFVGEVLGRRKHLYSIQRRMVQQGLEFQQIHDLMAFHIVVDSVADCYGVMGAIHVRFTPVPGRIKDYIALPKPNMYQSLHTTVIGPDRERIEIQIRTPEMHRVAEEGIAAHWCYKERISGGADPKVVDRFAWLRELMEFQRDIRNPDEFMESVKVDLFQEEVYVFTPKGDVRVLPRGATAVDFAYSIHTEIGNHCASVRVNGVVVPLRYALHNGDVIEITTGAQQQPRKEWLEYAATSRARNKIRAFLRSQEHERALKLGQELLEKELHSHGISMSRFLKSEKDLDSVLTQVGAPSATELFTAIGYGKIAAAAVTHALTDSSSAQGEPASDLREGKIEHFVRQMTGRGTRGIRVNDSDDILVRYARCCSPLPGDEIVGFITRGRGVTVHRRNCPKSFETDPDRRIDVVWDSRAKVARSVSLRVLTANRPGMLASLGEAFSDINVNISSVSSRPTEEGRSINVFSFVCADLDQLKLIIRAIRKVAGVYSVERT